MEAQTVPEAPIVAKMRKIHARLRKIDLNSFPDLNSLVQSIHSSTFHSFLIEKLPDELKRIEEKIFDAIKRMHAYNTSEEFVKAVLHNSNDTFNTVNIMTLFIVGLLHHEKMSLSTWLQDKDNDEYIIKFLLYVLEPSTIKYADSTSETQDLPKEEIIPETLCITGTESIQEATSESKVYFLDVLEDDVNWDTLRRRKHIITIDPVFWYIYVQWLFRRDDVGCYGVEYGNQSYLFLHDPPSENIYTSDEKENMINHLIKGPYEKYISCLKSLEGVKSDVKTTTVEFISNLSTTRFRYNVLLYIHLFVLSHYKKDKVILFVCNHNDDQVKQALWAGKTYQEFLDALQVTGDSLMIGEGGYKSVLEPLALAHLDLMMSRKYRFTSDDEMYYVRGDDKFITTCPVDYKWVFTGELASSAKLHQKIGDQMKMINDIGDHERIGILRRILDCIGDTNNKYIKNTRKQFFQGVHVGTKVKDRSGECYVIFDFQKYAKEKNINSNSSLIEICADNPEYQKAASEYFTEWHHCDFAHKYVVWTSEKNEYSVRDSVELSLVDETTKEEIEVTKEEINQFPRCPVCVQEIQSSMYNHMEEKHNEDFRKLKFKKVQLYTDKPLEEPGGKPVDISKPLEGPSGNAKQKVVEIPAQRTDNSAPSPGPPSAISNASNGSDVSISSENDAKFETFMAEKEKRRQERLKQQKKEDELSGKIEVGTKDTEKQRPTTAVTTSKKKQEGRSSSAQTKKLVPLKGRKNNPVFDEKFDTLQPKPNSSSQEQEKPNTDPPKPENEPFLPELVKPSSRPPSAKPESPKSQVPLPPLPSRPGSAARPGSATTPGTERGITDQSGDLEKVVGELEISHKGQQKIDENAHKELVELQETVNKAKEKHRKERERMKKNEEELKSMREELKQKNEEIQRLEGEHEEKTKEIKTNEEKLGKLKDDIAEKDDQVKKLHEEHSNKKDELASKALEISQLKQELEEMRTKNVDSLKTEKEQLQQQNLDIENQIQKHKELLERLKREIRENDQIKDRNMKLIDKEIDELYSIQIEELGLQDLLNEGKFEEFKKEVEEDNPVQEEHSACALFLIYESMAGTWKMFKKQQENGTVGSLITQKLMHEYRLYQSIKNHDPDVQAHTSKYFRQFKKDFVDKQAVEEIP